MRIFTYGETAPQISTQAELVPLTFKALPYHTNDTKIASLSLPDEVLTNKDAFPLIEDFELSIIDSRQNPQPTGSDIFARFVDRTKNEMLTYWEMYHIDKSELERSLPIPTQGQLIYEMESGYQIVIVADDDFVYIAQGDDDMPPSYMHYAKVPKGRYESEWKAFVEWYNAHPEKRSTQQTGKNDKSRNASKFPSTKESLPGPSSDSPMGKFNKAMRRILSVPKKDLKDK